MNRSRRPLCSLSLIFLLGTTGVCLAGSRTIDQHRDADPKGSVDITNLAGSLELIGWDRPEVRVTGTADPQVKAVELTGDALHTVIRVVATEGSDDGSMAAASLKVQVPRTSAITASTSSADYLVHGVQGAQRIQTVSGDIQGDVYGPLQVTTDSGDIHAEAHGGPDADVTTVSGDITLSGAAGDVHVKTISGDSVLNLGELTKARMESVSGDFAITLSLSTQAHADIESVSGDVHLRYARRPDAQLNYRTADGEIKDCRDQHRTSEDSIQHLTLQSGTGSARLNVNTQSGDIDGCP